MKNKVTSEAYIEELKIIKTVKNGTFLVASLPENILKTRLKKNLCYDHTRVVLKSANSSDFINANYVDGHKQKNKFIMTQGWFDS